MKLKAVLLASFLVLAVTPFESAEGTELVLRLNRDFGYGGFDNKIEGLFSLHAAGPDDLGRVAFFIDDNLMATLTEPPYRHQFSTNDYAPGEHRFIALGLTAAGLELRSNEVVRVFITKEETGQQVLGLIFPLLAGIAAVVVIVSLVSVVFGRKAATSGSYGMLGGTVCPRCALPYSLSLLAPRLLVGRLQRCPHCGKWALVRRARPDELSAAEARWRGDAAGQVDAEGAEKRAQRQIDDSRYVE